MPDARTLFTWAILAVGLAGTWGALVATDSTRELGGPAGAAPGVSWAAVPYLLAALAARRMAGAERASRFWLYVSVGLVSVTGGLLTQTLAATPAAEGALVFPILPVLQLAGLAPCWLWAERLRRQEAR